MFAAGAATFIALGAVSAGSAGAYAAGVLPTKVETCHNSNFVHLYAASSTTCYADSGFNSINIAKPEQVNGGNNTGQVDEQGNQVYFFFAGSGLAGLDPSYHATNVEIN